MERAVIFIIGTPQLGLGDMAQKIITIIIFISVDIDNYHDKCQIFISFKFKARFLLQSESFTNQTINFFIFIKHWSPIVAYI